MMFLDEDAQYDFRVYSSSIGLPESPQPAAELALDVTLNVKASQYHTV